MGNSIFISGLSADQVAKLNQANIGCVEFSIGRTPGIIFDESKLTSALALLGVSAKGSAPTEYQGVLQITLNIKGRSSAPAAPAPTSGTMAELFRQVEALQGLANLTEADRRLREELTGAVHAKQGALRTASEQLRTNAAALKNLNAHVAGIKAHNLSPEVTDPLDKVVAERSQALDQLRTSVSGLAAELAEAQKALDAELRKTRLSPEDALSAASAALNDASQASTAASAVVPPAAPAAAASSEA